MAKETLTTYSCEKCGKKLKGSHNNLNIVTSLSESMCWSRLHVQIVHKHGIHNSSAQEQADLCQSCAIQLLTEAVKRVKSNERATEGTEHPEQQNWES